jgi:nucleoside-diphosphate-sugar epimerase
LTKSVLFTGASGFIGRAVLPKLVEDGYEVHVVHRSRQAPPSAEVHVHHADLLDQTSAQTLIEAVRPSHLLHLAWYTAPGAFWASAENLAWVEASLRLLRAFGAAGGRRAVLTGTCAEYEPSDGPSSEAATPRRPTSLYGVCKNALQEMATAHAAELGYSLAWGRIFSPYGPHERPERLVPSVVQGLLAMRPVELSHGRQQRDFVYVDDLATALSLLLASELAGPVNLGSGEATSLREVVEAIVAATGHPELARFGARPAPDGEPHVLVADADRVRNELGWAPAVTLEEGIRRTVDWWRRPEEA